MAQGPTAETKRVNKITTCNGTNAASFSIKLSELKWVHVLEATLGWVNDVGGGWADWLSLGDNLLSGFLSLNLEGIVGLNSCDESKSALRFSEMVDSNVASLWDDSSVDELVKNDTAGMSGDVENSSGFTVIELVWHTLVDGTVSNNIDVISNLESGEVSLEWDSTVLLVGLGKKISSSCSNTK
jgi:hypothetical protein|tara:strand:- start:161 stop:712 length:552 start_codon:yes stop_codon:yes gene_type:complete